MLNILYVGVGGAVGAALRYGISGLSRVWFEGRFPVGTLAVNLLGCLAIGLLTPVMLEHRLVSPHVRLLLLTGLLGGLTTFSTFGYETFELVNDGQWWQAGLNVVLNNVLGIALVLIGFRITEKLLAA